MEGAAGSEPDRPIFVYLHQVKSLSSGTGKSCYLK